MAKEIKFPRAWGESGIHPGKREMNKKALALLSGGLDSSLAIKLMIDQGIEVTALHFTGPFCNCSPRKAGCKLQARKVANELGIPIQVIAKGMDYMRMVENPPHGYGRALNPCIDCRIYMLKKAKEVMAATGASFIITGEVLGQRPMSQHRQALRIIEKESGLEGLILRPLSARNFPPTLPEMGGIVKRERLLAFSGRSRKGQIKLAETLGLHDYPCPSGGCLLTDRIIALRLKDLFGHHPDYTIRDLLFLRFGRHYRLTPRIKVILGRNREENERIRSLAPPGSTLFLPEGFRGPTAIAFGTLTAPEVQMIGEIVAHYSQEEKKIYSLRQQTIGGEESLFSVSQRFPPEKLIPLRIG